MCDLYLKQPTHHQYVLVRYDDFSKKMVCLNKYNNKVMLFKAYPTSKACVKYMMQMVLEIGKDHMTELISLLNKIKLNKTIEGQMFFIVGTEQQQARRHRRLVLKSSEYGGWVLKYEKLEEEELQEDDLTFNDDDDAQTSTSVYYNNQKKENWVEEFSAFHIKKSDDMNVILQELRHFHAAIDDGKKCRIRKKKNTEFASGKERNKIKIESDGDDGDDEEVSLVALTSLFGVMRLRTTEPFNQLICKYNDYINESLPSEDQTDFVKLLQRGLGNELEELYKTFCNIYDSRIK